MEKRICKDCHQEKELSKFSNYVHKKTGVKYYKNTCISCKYRRSCLKRKYNITPDDYNRMLLEQEGKCKICETTLNPNSKNNHLDVDHCHTTGEVRGLLCNRCNKAIGYFNDDIVLIQKALEYLKK